MSLLVKRSFSIALGGLLISATMLSGASPLTRWVSALPMVTNIVSTVNLPTVLVAMSGFPGRNAPSMWTLLAVGTVQWLFYGVVLAWLWSMLRPEQSMGAGGR